MQLYLSLHPLGSGISRFSGRPHPDSGSADRHSHRARQTDRDVPGGRSLPRGLRARAGDGEHHAEALSGRVHPPALLRGLPGGAEEVRTDGDPQRSFRAVQVHRG